MEWRLAARQRPLPGYRAVLGPAPAALLVRSGNEGCVGIPVRARRRPHRLRFGTGDGHVTVALQLLPVAAVDQSPVVPRLGNQRLKFAHAASASCAPTDATAARPSSSAAPAARAATASTARIWPSS